MAVASADQTVTPQDEGEFDWSTIQITLSPDQTRQFVTMYEDLGDFDDRQAQAQLRCPHLCFAGSKDEIVYGPRWGDAAVAMGGLIAAHQLELEALGWSVELLDGLDHTQAMQPNAVLPVLRPWLRSVARSL